MWFFSQNQLQLLLCQVDVGVSLKIIINTGFTRTLTYESFSQVTENLLTVWEAHAEICLLPQLESWMHYKCITARNQRQVFHVRSSGWRWSKHFWKLIWGSGPNKRQFYFKRTGVLSLVTVIVNLLISHKTSVRCELHKCILTGIAIVWPDPTVHHFFPEGQRFGMGNWILQSQTNSFSSTKPYWYLTSQERPAYKPVAWNSWKWNGMLQTWAKKITSRIENSSHSECKTMLKQHKIHI